LFSRDVANAVWRDCRSITDNVAVDVSEIDACLDRILNEVWDSAARIIPDFDDFGAMAVSLWINPSPPPAVVESNAPASISERCRTSGLLGNDCGFASDFGSQYVEDGAESSSPEFSYLFNRKFRTAVSEVRYTYQPITPLGFVANFFLQSGSIEGTVLNAISVF